MSRPSWRTRASADSSSRARSRSACCWRSRPRRPSHPGRAGYRATPTTPTTATAATTSPTTTCGCKYQPTTDRLQGTATLLATTTQDLSRFNLDFLLDVSEVRVNGTKAASPPPASTSWRSPRPRRWPRASRSRVVVRYSGVPSKVKATASPPGGAPRTAASRPTSRSRRGGGSPATTTRGQGHLRRVGGGAGRASRRSATACCGSPRSRCGWTRYNWRSTSRRPPIWRRWRSASSTSRTDTTANGLPVINAYSKDLGAQRGPARASVERTAEIDRLAESGLRPVPVQRGRRLCAERRPSRYALETQTRPFYSPGFCAKRREHLRRRARAGPPVVRRQRLAERLEATSGSTRASPAYAEWLWSEEQGEGTAQELADYVYARTRPTTPSGRSSRATRARQNQFDDAVYDRGAMALQALRQPDRRRGLLRDPEGLADEHRLRQRHGRRLRDATPRRCPGSRWGRCSTPGCSADPAEAGARADARAATAEPAKVPARRGPAAADGNARRTGS